LQGNVATQLRWGGSLYNRPIENFLWNLAVKELWKISVHLPKLWPRTKWLFFGKRFSSYCCGTEMNDEWYKDDVGETVKENSSICS